jgi:thiamine biosynthesis lipoprotein
MLARKFIIIGLLIVVIGMLAFSERNPVEVHLQGSTMGTTYNVKFSPVDGLDPGLIHQQIDSALQRVNALMSTYDQNSELSLFNSNTGIEAVPMSSETLAVLKEAIRLSEMTDGALDITIGPVVNLWGFGPTKRPEIVPTDEQIAHELAQVGIEKLIIEGQTARKTNPDLYVDLSTIAKGYGVDVVAELLLAAGAQNYLVEIGGEMRVAGQKINQQPWRIAIEKPISSQRILQKVIEIGDNGLATSGDYRNYYEQDGVRYSHLIDPSNGKPIQHNLVSATVVHPSSMTADGLSTAMMVIGPEKAKEIANKHGLSVLLITKNGDQFVEWMSESFKQSVSIVTPQ